MAATVGAMDALRRREEDAVYELRATLVDLAAVCELLADELPPPTAFDRHAASR